MLMQQQLLCCEWRHRHSQCLTYITHIHPSTASFITHVDEDETWINVSYLPRHPFALLHNSDYRWIRLYLFFTRSYFDYDIVGLAFYTRRWKCIPCWTRKARRKGKTTIFLWSVRQLFIYFYFASSASCLIHTSSKITPLRVGTLAF